MNLNNEEYFSSVPKLDVPRSVFQRDFSHKMTMNCDYFYPIFIDEMLPGDTMHLDFQVFGRVLNPLRVPVMDELYFETLWFQCPWRLLWNHTFAFFGERENPDDSTDYVLPTVTLDHVSPNGLFDHFGINPLAGSKKYVSLPFRMYNLCYNQWLRNQNLIASVDVPLGDEDNASYYTLLKSHKIHDVFTSMLPDPQLGDPVKIPLGTTAPVMAPGGDTPVYNQFLNTTANNFVSGQLSTASNTSGQSVTHTSTSHVTSPFNTNMYADLANANGVIDINDFRFLMKLQRYRERLMLGGHRYREIISQFYGVDQLDNRAYIPEYLGSTRTMIDINSVIQTSSTDTTSPLGNIASYGLVNSFNTAFKTSAVEHSYLLGLARIRHNPIYQQGTNKLWLHETALDIHNPMFDGIGEQPVLTEEVVTQGDLVVDENGDSIDKKPIGCQEAWYFYRYYPSYITGQLRSGIPLSLDMYHFGQFFGHKNSDNTYSQDAPLLNQSFVESDVPFDRASSISTDDNRGIVQFVFDFRFKYTCYRVMPVHNIPAGLYEGI